MVHGPPLNSDEKNLKNRIFGHPLGKKHLKAHKNRGAIFFQKIEAKSIRIVGNGLVLNAEAIPDDSDRFCPAFLKKCSIVIFRAFRYFLPRGVSKRVILRIFDEFEGHGVQNTTPNRKNRAVTTFLWVGRKNPAIWILPILTL